MRLHLPRPDHGGFVRGLLYVLAFLSAMLLVRLAHGEPAGTYVKIPNLMSNGTRLSQKIGSLNFPGGVTYNASTRRFDVTAVSEAVFSVVDDIYTHTLRLGAVADSQWLKIAAGDPGRYVDFYGTYSSFAGVGGIGYRDNVVNLGHNCAPGGGAVIAGRIATCIGLESIFRGGQDQSEMHLYTVAPSGTQTRLFSAEQHTSGSTALYLAATTIAMGSGINTSAPSQLNLSATTSIIQSPSLLRKLILDDAGGNNAITLQNGIVGNTDRAKLLLGSDGAATLMGKSFIRLYGGATGAYLALQIDGNTTQIVSPNGLGYVLVQDGVGPYIYANGGPSMFFQNAQTITYNPIRPAADRDATRSIGVSGGRFGFMAVSLAAASLPACDADSQGFMTTVPGGAGASDTVRACLKAAADTYAWRTIYTAP